MLQCKFVNKYSAYPPVLLNVSYGIQRDLDVWLYEWWLSVIMSYNSINFMCDGMLADNVSDRMSEIS